MADGYTVTIQKNGFEQQFKGYETLEKQVANGGHSARVFVPKSWVGKKVRVILLEPLEEPEGEEE